MLSNQTILGHFKWMENVVTVEDVFKNS